MSDEIPPTLPPPSQSDLEVESVLTVEMKRAFVEKRSQSDYASVSDQWKSLANALFITSIGATGSVFTALLTLRGSPIFSGSGLSASHGYQVALNSITALALFSGAVLFSLLVMVCQILGTVRYSRFWEQVFIQPKTEPTWNFWFARMFDICRNLVLAMCVIFLVAGGYCIGTAVVHVVAATFKTVPPPS